MTAVLGIDTATIAVSAALVVDGVVCYEVHLPGARQQVELLHPALVEVLDSGPRPDVVAVDVGPGRFTGLRVGVASAKGLAFALGIPIIGCTSLEILLAQSPEPDCVAVVDLRRGEVAALCSGDDPQTGIVRTTPTALGAALVDRGRSRALLVGDGATGYAPAIASGAGRPVRVGPAKLAAPRATALCHLAVNLGGGPREQDAAALVPVYLRGADVRLGWTTREGAGTFEHLEVG